MRLPATRDRSRSRVGHIALASVHGGAALLEGPELELGAPYACAGTSREACPGQPSIPPVERGVKLSVLLSEWCRNTTVHESLLPRLAHRY